MVNQQHVLIAPSILSADLRNLEQQVKEIEQAGADWIHVDVMDGHFVPNITFGVNMVRVLRKMTSLPLDIQLMISTPLKHISSFIEAGSSSISFHIESTKEVNTLIKIIKKSSILCGLAIKPKTLIEDIYPYLKFIDYVCLMTVEPGFSGQSMLSESSLRVKNLKEEIKRQGLSTKIEVDGGVNDKTASQVKGVDIMVSGHYIFSSMDYSSAISELRKQASS